MSEGLLMGGQFPIDAEHPAIGTKCRACNIRFMPGDALVLVPLGPGADPEERALARHGRAFNAVAIPIHYACATGFEE